MSPSGRSRLDVGMSRSTSGSLSSRLIVGGTDAVAQRHDGGDGLEGAGAAEQVAGHRLGAGDHAAVDVLAEDGVEHQALRDVALGGRGGVGVDVDDGGRVDVALAERHLDGAGAAATLGVGLGDVVGVVADAGAEDLGVDRRAAGTGVLLGLEDQHGAALAEDEAVAAGVPGARDRRGVAAVVAAGGLGERHHVGEGGHRQRVDRGLGAAGDDDVGAAEADQVDGHRDGLVAGGAGRGGRVDRRAGAVLEADVGGRGVGHEHRHGERGDPTGALLEQRVVVGEQRGDAADAGGERDAEALGLEAGALEAGVGPGLVGGDHGELAGAVEATGLDAVEDLGRARRRRGRRCAREGVDPLVVEVADAGGAGQHGLPRRGDVPTDR